MNIKDPDWNNDICITMPAHWWLTIHGNVCLGLRHPDNKGSSRGVAITCLTRIENVLLSHSLLSPDDISHIHKTGY